MDTNPALAIVAASASMVTGKRIDDLRVEFQAFRVEIKAEVKELRREFA